MSRRLIARSPDLLRLQNEGFDLEVRGGYLLVKDIPYVDSNRNVLRGILVMELDLANDVTKKPKRHTAQWIGEHPCHHDGRKITAFENPTGAQDLGDGIRTDHYFSAKADYRDYHHKVTTYVGRIEAEAQVLQDISARTFPLILPDEDDDDRVFRYVDTATTRAGIGAVNSKLAGLKIGIVGLGGTGAYILDLVAKTCVNEIHIFDGDTFSQHNAFRCPGAPAGEVFETKPEPPKKVDYLFGIYDRMRKGIVRYPAFLDSSNASLLDGLDFVFLCLDRADPKRSIVDRLVETNIPFIEVGMGVLLDDAMLGGIVRMTTSTPETREQAGPHISFADDGDRANEYATNIQIAELNALNAAMAVVRWKKIFGVYRDSGRDFYAGFSLSTGTVATECAP